MKQKLHPLCVALLTLVLCNTPLFAEDFAVGGIYYDITSETDKTVAVTYRGDYYDSYSNEYYGVVTIPESVTHNGNTYSVTSIGRYAFYYCKGLTSVEIPNSVTSIGDAAFYFCSSLTFVEIGNSVTSIGSSAFSRCSSLTSVEIPNSVTSIGSSAFSGCSSLTSVVIPNNVTSIGYYAFGGCSSLTSVEIPNSVTSIGSSAFCSCSSLTSVEIPNSVTSIGNETFSGCSSLTSVEIPNSVTSIGNEAFSNCSGLTSVVIPNSVTSIGGAAFSGCSSLTSVEIPNSVTSIGYGAFSHCSSLTSITVAEGNQIYDSRNNCNAIIETQTNTLIAGCNETTIPNSVTSIGDFAFYDCPRLTSVEIPNSVTSIGNEAFSNCSGLTSVVIPNSVTSIGNWAFSGCSSLTSVEIPNSVTSIGNDTFRNCSSLTSVVIPNSVTSIGESAFSHCSGLTSVEIPNSVTSIEAYAFYCCSSLTSIEIPNSVTSIGDAAFCDCDNLKSITSLNPTPPSTPYYPFDNYGATLYVPFGAKTAYSKANDWKEFTNIEELAPSHYELTDGEEYNEASDMTLETLTYTRTLPNLHWNALYVPFELPYDVVAEHYDVAYINDVNGYDTDDNGTIDDLAMEIIKIKGGTLKANYPYLIKAKTEADKAMSITVEDATLYAAAENSVDCSSVYQNYTVTGIYTKKTAEELAGMLAISTSGAWQPLAAGTALNPFRLYLSIKNRDNSPLKVETSAMSRMRIVERGETTGVETITPAQQREDVIIDLSGRRVKQPVKGGLYIVNGKKQIF